MRRGMSYIKRAAEEGVTLAKVGEMREGIEGDTLEFRVLLDVPRTEPTPSGTLAAIPS